MDQALGFVERHDLTLSMYWDATFESWAQLGITGQPSAALFDADGTVLGAWRGAIPEDEVLELIRA